ncbi:hypothetical protein BD779DRAFT_1667143 [Infundibulicybe gibba]|nr:hypothetical protein BD779DRAFT_1667143 [Infundibulicybe gibba]
MANQAAVNVHIENSWARLKTPLHRVMDFSMDLNDKNPLDAAIYVDLYTICYNFCRAAVRDQRRYPAFYSKVEQLFAEIAHNRQLQLAPSRDIPTLLPEIISSFDKYEIGARLVARLLLQFDHHYIARDMSEKTNRAISPSLKLWGYDEVDPSSATSKSARASAEAASSQYIIPITSLARRRFRIELVEPLLTESTVNTGASAGEGSSTQALGPTPFIIALEDS